MTEDNRTPEEIERDIEEKRFELTSNIEDLQDKFSLDTVIRQIGDQFREHGGDMGRSISQQVKANPIPLALTGIGLAWMMFGNNQRVASSNQFSGVNYRSSDDYNRSEFERGDYSRSERDFRERRLAEGRPYTPPQSRISNYRNTPTWMDRNDYNSDENNEESSITDHAAEKLSEIRDGAAEHASATKERAVSTASRVSDKASSAKSTLSETASAAGSNVASGVEAVRSRASDLTSRIAEGTESLSEEGRQRVIVARQKAIELRRKAEQAMSSSTDAAADFYDRQPLVIGGFALAVGAALGGALPRTEIEDKHLGARSDALTDEAERIFEEEKQKAMSIAQSVKREIKDIASETKDDLDRGAPGDKSIGQALSDEVKSAATRVTKKAKSEAKKKDLGKPNT